MTRGKQLLQDKRFKLAAAITIIAATFGLFGYYLATHPEVLAAVTDLDAATLALLSLAYIGTIAANAFVLFVSLRLIGKRVGYMENFVLTGYSSIVNFFGPLQSGPGFRAAYLKQKHSVGLKRFFSVTIIFYVFFALLNGSVIGIALLANLEPAAAMVALSCAVVLAGLIVMTGRNNRRAHEALQSIRFTNPNLWLIGLGALLLAFATAIAYYIELTHVDPGVSFTQTIIYTAAANLALFVSLTPGAIGFRESFLLLSRQLHGITTDTVVAASIIDRAFYVLFLLVLFVALLVLGLRGRFRIKQP